MPPMELSRESFMRACREGGRLIETWLRVFDREHGAAMYREAAAVLHDWHAAEDVVQDALVRAWQRCTGFAGSGHPVGWIRQIVRNAVLDHLRARRPETPLHDDEGELSPEVAAAVQQAAALEGDVVSERLAEQQVEQVFRRCFQRFEQDWPQHATVLLWVVEDGLDNAALQELLGRTPGATREFVSQCRKKARPYFADWYALVGPGSVPPAGGP